MSGEVINHNNKKHYTKISTLLCGVILFFLIQCGVNNSEINAGNKEKINIDPVYNETALFLAGKEIPQGSGLYQYSETKEYRSYCKQINTNWEKLQELNAKKINKWRERHLSGEYTDIIYYPFSGPDILNALIFFPDGKEYIMFGLESPGEIPQPQKVKSDKLRSGLRGLSKALVSMFNLNFFRTNEMKEEISTNDFDSITGIMMFFLARTNYEVLNVRKIWIDEQAGIIFDKPKMGSKKIIPGSEIYFRKSKEKPVQKVVYHQIDVGNWSLKNHNNYTSYIISKGRLTTIIKSASYLMHREKEFDQIRSLILSQSDYLLQDDSGIPLRCFLPSDWKLTFHGIYIRPIKAFAIRYQKDFDKAMKENSTGPLDFSYGYNYVTHKHNLIFAERIKK